MTQFNLLPDVKVQYIKSQHLNRLIITIATLASVVAVFIFVLILLYVDVAQKVHLTDLTNDIHTNSAQLSSDTNLGKIITVQNQLQTLPKIEAQTPVTARLFTYLTELTPTAASITSLQADFTQNTISITGDADSLATVNTFIDAIKFTTYKTASDSTSAEAFSTAVLSSFGYASQSNDAKPANFTITFDFDPNIFSNTQDVTLTVPKLVTTRSILSQPTDLFENGTATSGGTQ